MHNIYPWQQEKWQHLARRLSQGNLAHAFLFFGPEGVGKLHFARAFAELLLCAKPNLDKACGACSNCFLLNADTHPDLLILQPEEESKVIKIEQIRSLSVALSQTAQQGGYKIAIIAPADAMNLAAANALLKTLEEPEGQTVLILISSRPNALPATIRSRCQAVSFPVPDLSLSRTWLLKQLSANRCHDIDGLLAAADAAPLKALGLSSSDDLGKREELLLSLLALRKGETNPIIAAEKSLQLELKTFCTYLTNWSMLLIKLKIMSNCNLPNQECNELQQLITNMDLKRLFAYFDKLLNLNKFIGEGLNLNKQLTMDDLLIDWVQL